MIFKWKIKIKLSLNIQSNIRVNNYLMSLKLLVDVNKKHYNHHKHLKQSKVLQALSKKSSKELSEQIAIP